MDASRFLQWALAVLSSFAFTLVFAADADPGKARIWSSPRLPFEPRLIEADAKEQSTCAILLGAARKAFLDNSTTIDLGAVLPDDAKPVTWTELGVPFEKASGDGLEYTSLDLGKDGNTQILVKRANDWSWRGATFSAFLFTDKAVLDAALQASKTVDEFVSHGRPFYPPASDRAPMDGAQSWAWNELFALGDGYYFLDQGNDFALIQAQAVKVYRLAADGDTRAVCNVALSDPAALASFESRPALKAFIRVMRGIGTGGPDCGTLHAATTHENGARGAVLRAALRPWAVSIGRKSDDYYSYSPRVEAFLVEWGFGDPWSRREFLTFDEHRRAAQREMAEYLAAAFGLTKEQSAAEARRVINDIVAAHLLLPSSYAPAEHGPVAGGVEELAASAYVGDNLRDEPLFAVLNDPVARRAYLDKATDKEAPNAFGKTLLMYAAHLNQLDAVKDLLAAGANVNAATPPAEASCENPMQHYGRTPLMYAAENASVEVMDALLAAGASIEVKDSEGLGIDDYLARNPRLAALGAPLPKTMTDALQRFHQQAVGNEPSFSCAGKLNELETIICSDPLAALYDREMASGFARWKAKLADADKAVAEQLDWIRRRNRGCGAMDGEDAKRLCVEETLRARSRYIENRLAE